jgi:SAM-dependent methyltransferase
MSEPETTSLTAQARRHRFEARYFPEVEVGGFSRLSPGVLFWSRIAALIEPQFRVLDYGAGRGAFVAEDRSAYARGLKVLKGRVAHVSGCDVDPAVLENPTLDDAKVIDPKQPLPYADGAFDMVISSYVLEHVDDPAFVAAELARVVKPGGWRRG